jgi:glucose-6-phosphate 1-dehydrogenase
MQLRPVDMRFSYRESFAAPSPDAYETLLWDVMKRDATLFMRADQVEAAWQLLMPVLEAWQATAPSDFPNYAAGTWGPENTQGLLAPGHRWPLPTELVTAGKKKWKIS